MKIRHSSNHKMNCVHCDIKLKQTKSGITLSKSYNGLEPLCYRCYSNSVRRQGSINGSLDKLKNRKIMTSKKILKCIL